MTTPTPSGAKGPGRWPLVIVGVLFLLITGFFLYEFMDATGAEVALREVTPVADGLTSDSYLSEVTRLLADADAASGARWVEEFGCIACHRLAGNVNIAPNWQGIAARAGDRRPPLTAAAYLYESITQPTNFVVADYLPSMPADYATRLTEKQLGDIIAYLLTADAH
jgi:mono/diheme cytochrome c family protein